MQATKYDKLSLSSVKRFYQDGWSNKCLSGNHKQMYYFNICNDIC